MKKVSCLLLVLALLVCLIGCADNSSEPSVTSSSTSSTVSEPSKASPYEQLCEFVKTNGKYTSTNGSYEYTYVLSSVIAESLTIQLQPNGQIRFSLLGDYSTSLNKAETLIFLDFVDGASSLKISYAMQIDIVGYLAKATIDKSILKDDIKFSIEYEDINYESHKSTCREMFITQADHLMSQVDTFLIASVDICLYDLGFYNFPQLT